MANKKIEKKPNRVAQLRKERGLSQSELGEELFLDQRSVSFMENGNCNLSNLIAAADFFNVTLDYILLRTNDCGKLNYERDELDYLILEQLKGCTASEKERLLKHLELDNSMKIGSHS